MSSTYYGITFVYHFSTTDTLNMIYFLTSIQLYNIELYAGATLKVRKKDLLIMKKALRIMGRTYCLLTAWSRVLLEKLLSSYRGSQEIPSILWNPWFITAFTQPATCVYPQPDQSSPCHPIALPEDPS